MDKELTLRECLAQLNIGESFVTTANRAAIFVTAKRLGIKIKTGKTPENDTSVLRVEPDSSTPLDDALDAVKRLSIRDRVKLFESFELCCGMNRGDCVCPPEPVEVKPIASYGNDPLAAFIAKAQAKKGITVNPVTDQIEVDIDITPREWFNHTEERSVLDVDTGETVYYREHLKTRKRTEIRRETAW